VTAAAATAQRLAGSARLSLTEVLEATGGELRSLGRCTGFAGVTTDTRGIENGELFVAVKGETRDGHDFLEDAARGRRRCRGGRARARPTATCRVRWWSCATRSWRSATSPRITGGASSRASSPSREQREDDHQGDALAILEQAFGSGGVLRTLGTQNNLVGLPLTLLRLAGGERAVILEMGMNAPGRSGASRRSPRRTSASSRASRPRISRASARSRASRPRRASSTGGSGRPRPRS
jgi:hypothetical protein